MVRFECLFTYVIFLDALFLPNYSYFQEKLRNLKRQKEVKSYRYENIFIEFARRRNILERD